MGKIQVQIKTLLRVDTLTADPGVEREAIGPGHPLQSGIRSVQRADGADHERCAV